MKILNTKMSDCTSDGTDAIVTVLNKKGNTMSDKIMITPNQVKANEPYEGFAKQILGGRITQLDRPLPLSEILGVKVDNFDNFDHIDNTICCFTCLPPKDSKGILVKFALFCAKRAVNHVDDKLMRSCINVIEDFINYGIGLEQLNSTIIVADVIAEDYCDLPLGFASESVGDLARLIHKDADSSKKIYSYATGAYLSALQIFDNDDAEVEAQTAYLRKLLDGEES